MCEAVFLCNIWPSVQVEVVSLKGRQPKFFRRQEIAMDSICKHESCVASYGNPR